MKKYILIIALLLLAIFAKAQDWKPNPKYIKQRTQDTSHAHKKQFQCYGTTQAGNRCKRKVETDKTYCYQHANQKP